MVQTKLFKDFPWSQPGETIDTQINAFINDSSNNVDTVVDIKFIGWEGKNNGGGNRALLIYNTKG